MGQQYFSLRFYFSKASVQRQSTLISLNASLPRKVGNLLVVLGWKCKVAELSTLKLPGAHLVGCLHPIYTPAKSFWTTARISRQRWKVSGEPVSISVDLDCFLLGNKRWGVLAGVSLRFLQDTDSRVLLEPNGLPVWLRFLLFCELLPSTEIFSPALHRHSGLARPFFSFQTFEHFWHIWAAVIHRASDDAVILHIGCLNIYCSPNNEHQLSLAINMQLNKYRRGAFMHGAWWPGCWKS